MFVFCYYIIIKRKNVELMCNRAIVLSEDNGV